MAATGATQPGLWTLLTPKRRGGLARLRQQRSGSWPKVLLLTLVGFQPALMFLGALVLAALVTAMLLIRGDLGAANKKARFSHMFSQNRAVNLLAAARIFLFGARDVWFVVGLPVFFVSVLGWDFWLAGGFMAAWTIGYGLVQAATPRLVQGVHDLAIDVDLELIVRGVADANR